MFSPQYCGSTRRFLFFPPEFLGAAIEQIQKRITSIILSDYLMIARLENLLAFPSVNVVAKPVRFDIPFNL
jgi:hypothetical protein